MRFVVGQVPVQSLSITLTTGTGVADLAVYTGFDVVLRDPNGNLVDTSGGSTTVVDGRILYAWPTATLFPSPGDYSLQVKCKRGAAVDWTDKAVVQVYREDV